MDHRQFDALTHGFASTAPFGGGSADAVAATISAIRARLSRDYMPVTALVIALPMPAKMPPNRLPLNGNEVTVPSEPNSVSVTG